MVSKDRINQQEYQRLSEIAANKMFGGDLDVLTTQLFLRLMRLGNRLSKDFERAVRSKADISLPGYQLLFTLNAVGPLGSNELARLSAVSTASMTSLLHTLERKGYVTRENDPSDARKKIIDLTDTGKSLVKVLHRENVRHQLGWSQALSRPEGEMLNELVAKLLAHQPEFGEPDEFPRAWKKNQTYDQV